MSSTKKLQKAAQKFRRENPKLYAQYAVQYYYLAKLIKEYGSSGK
jgi:hypothetical protein|nr:MAG TPA: hypothetical protein [Caudoviricetes sp.]